MPPIHWSSDPSPLTTHLTSVFTLHISNFLFFMITQWFPPWVHHLLISVNRWYLRILIVLIAVCCYHWPALCLLISFIILYFACLLFLCLFCLFLIFCCLSIAGSFHLLSGSSLSVIFPSKRLILPLTTVCSAYIWLNNEHFKRS